MPIANPEIPDDAQMRDGSINQFMKWGNHLSVGHPEIDAQHREIYDFGSEIYESWRNGVRVGELRMSTDRLLKLLRAHFVFEERLLAGIGYSDLKQHVAEHRSMLKELQGMRDHFENIGDDDDTPGGSVLSPNWSVMRFILGFALGHVLTSDMNYCQALTASGNAAKSAEAGA